MPKGSTNLSDNAAAASSVTEWLICEGRRYQQTGELFGALCQRLQEGGVVLRRATLNIRTLHPQFIAKSFIWHRDRGIEEIDRVQATALTTQYINSLLRVIYEGGDAMRRRLDTTEAIIDFPILAELKAEGMTDYLAVPLHFLDGKIHVMTAATDREGGFTSEDVATLRGLIPTFALLVEVHTAGAMAATLLNTYLGPQAGANVLKGQIKRGDTQTIGAVLWYSDLRGFTAMSDREPADRLVAALNDYFECLACPVQDRGGEVLKFIGDGILAIFPLGEASDPHDTCTIALDATLDGFRRLDALNEKRSASGEADLRCAVALHVGDVMYGNIGAPDRLDFTVIGPAVNLVTRLESMSKPLDRRMILSAAFAKACGTPLVSLGFHALRGLQEPEELFGLATLAAASEAAS